jgi:serine/threonine protein kinase
MGGEARVVWHSFGRVRLATHSHTGTVCAVKILSKAQILNQDQLIHMKQEKAILDEVAYPFMVNLFGATQVSPVHTARPAVARTPSSNRPT